MDKDVVNNQIDNDMTNPVINSNLPVNSLGAIATSQIVTGSGSIALDLVVIIDTSGSMSDESSDLSQQIDAAIEKASAECPSQLRATFLGIQGTWDKTKFDQSVSDYLTALGVSQGSLQARQPFKEADGIDHAGNKEDLCRAVIDVSNYFDWRDNARRAIFVLGDEGLEGGGGTLTSAAVLKNNEAITVAQNAHVKVYTYQGTPNDDPSNIDRFPTLGDRDKVTKEYERLAVQTGGRSYIYTTGIANFTLVLQEILCDSLTPPGRPEIEKSSCATVCEQLPLIIATVNTLAEIINKTIDACCSKEPDKHHDVVKPCQCTH
ncbi:MULTISPECIES: VWA domain-containing protein [Providencia]|uniref:VWA domain-containing protein n=1 Tax=Providencia TaxID=586 RepID=UPI001C5A8F59|nr:MULTISPECIES: VWA domain-containing protein [Providencia]QXX82349.1 VWA domain-containing protein [Providencia sp. R33]